jgi:hypothetical protein
LREAMGIALGRPISPWELSQVKSRTLPGGHSQRLGVLTAGQTPITEEELQQFVACDLELIDNREYFERVFGSYPR